MKVIPKPISFEWDSGNITKNPKKHNVTNQEAEEIFFNHPFVTIKDKTHSLKEVRFQSLGKTNNNRKLFLVFTIRINKIRVISVRDMNKKEAKNYEKIKIHS